MPRLTLLWSKDFVDYYETPFDLKHDRTNNDLLGEKGNLFTDTRILLPVIITTKIKKKWKWETTAYSCYLKSDSLQK